VLCLCSGHAQEHRHPYVRKNAVLTILTVYKYNENLMPDAPELIQNYLSTVRWWFSRQPRDQPPVRHCSRTVDRCLNAPPHVLQEQDMSCRRNAFIMLYNCDQQRAVEYLGNVIDQVGGFPESLQLVIIELIRKVCRTTPSERVRGPDTRHWLHHAHVPSLTTMHALPGTERLCFTAQVHQVHLRSDELVVTRSQVRERRGAYVDHSCANGREG